jgi:hypothetical protein
VLVAASRGARDPPAARATLPAEQCSDAPTASGGARVRGNGACHGQYEWSSIRSASIGHARPLSGERISKRTRKPPRRAVCRQRRLPEGRGQQVDGTRNRAVSRLLTAVHTSCDVRQVRRTGRRRRLMDLSDACTQPRSLRAERTGATMSRIAEDAAVTHECMLEYAMRHSSRALCCHV